MNRIITSVKKWMMSSNEHCIQLSFFNIKKQLLNMMNINDMVSYCPLVKLLLIFNTRTWYKWPESAHMAWHLGTFCPKDTENNILYLTDKMQAMTKPFFNIYIWKICLRVYIIVDWYYIWYFNKLISIHFSNGILNL